MGHAKTFDASLSSTFKQAMHQYQTAGFSLYSVKNNELFTVLPGGISLNTVINGATVLDQEVPFTNQVTTIRTDAIGSYTQHLMNARYPTIASTTVNPGNTLLFGAGAYFIDSENVSAFSNGTLQYDKLPTSPIVVGYIVRGIASTEPNVTATANSFASERIFKVTIQKN